MFFGGKIGIIDQPFLVNLVLGKELWERHVYTK